MLTMPLRQSLKNSTETLQRLALAHAPVWGSAAVVGVLAVAYAKMISRAQTLFFSFFERHTPWIFLTTPVLFVAATALVRFLAPEAKGSGIPQVLEAIDAANESEVNLKVWESRLVSVRTASVKIISSLFGILGGASIGREGPTVQIACSAFAWIGRKAKSRFPGIHFQTYLTAGAATGVAAAFNTPIAGIAFALEEIAESDFTAFKRVTILAVVVGGIVAQSLIGDYLYFGKPAIPTPGLEVIGIALLIGVLGGTLAGIFARLLSRPELTRLPSHWVLRTVICGVICASFAYLTGGATSGSGYEVTRQALESSGPNGFTLGFPIWKLITTVFSYLSGMAGGIFAPSLSIGAGLGYSFSNLLNLGDPRACALLGMVAFFAGAVQAPLTAVVIVMEMTDQRALTIPFLVAAFLAQGIGKLFMPVSLYRYLAQKRRIA